MSLVDPVTATDVAEQTNQEAPDQVVEPQVDESVPEKFRGKSVKEIVESYQNLESELGRSRNEIGTQRRVVDELLNLRRGSPEKSEQVPAARPVTPHDLAENPEEVITAVARREADQRTAQAEERLAKLEGNLAAEQFEKRNPGYQETVKAPKFAEWVKQSPIRVRLVQGAAQNDWEAAEEVLALYKEYEALTPSGAATPGADKSEAKKAGLAKSGGSGANKVVNGGDGKKTYSRAELARLYIDKPEEYDRRYETEFLAAYQEGRVK